MSVARHLPVVVVLAALFAPVAARAGNGLHPRTPVEWPADVACMTVVDRSQSPVLHFEYGIPYEDTDVTPDEVPDSRRHQFVAFCKNHSPQEPLPTWLSEKDVLAAAMTDPPLHDVEDVPPDDIMEVNPDYKDCFVRILADEERRPITFAEAMKGVDWDTTGLPAGPYIIEGYTWEPVFNVWYKRHGVVHVVDGPDLAAVAPAAALMNVEDYMFGNDTLTLQGCARALPGSKLTGYWSLTGETTLDWKTFAVDVPLDGEAISLAFDPPIEAVGETITLRVDVTDPMQRTFSTFAYHVISVLPGSGETGGCADTGSFIGENCGGGSTSESGPGTGGTTFEPGGTDGSTGGPTTSGDSSGGSSGEPATGGKLDEPTGCGCDSGGAGGAWVLAALGLAVRRRKRGSTLGPS
jgi:MYXO-CTERM domain-containing protein